MAKINALEPDFVKLSEAFGIPAFFVRERKDVPRAIDRLLNEPGPLLAHVSIEQAANVWPLVLYQLRE